MAIAVHRCGRGIGRDGRLAHRQHMRAGIPLGSDRSQEIGQVVDIVVEVEAAVRQRHQLRIAPVGDVDVGRDQHPPHRVAQQRRVMARHRRHDQQLGSAGHAFANEMLELAEGLAQHDLFTDRDFAAVDHRLGDAERRLAARGSRMREDFQSRRKHRPAAEIGKRVRRVLEQARAEVRHGAGTSQHRSLEFVSVVQHQETVLRQRARAGRHFVPRYKPLRSGCNHRALVNRNARRRAEVSPGGGSR